MAAPMEVAVCTDSAAQLWSCIVWELHSGANLLTYRGGQAGPRGLALLNGEYLLAAQLGKNYISAWELQRKDQLQQKIMCPGPVTCLTTSPNGLYVLAGIAESIYLWEVSTGNLLVILSRHYQDVSCLQFTGDGSHFLSGGKDCLVLAWSLCSVLQVDPSRTPAPRHVWSRHTLPITDLHCGFGGPLARVATSSLDQTVKLWEVSSGELLLSVLFDVGIMAVTMDLAEHHLFCGGSDGSIFQVDLCTWPGQREKAFQPEQDSGKVFRGHRCGPGRARVGPCSLLPRHLCRLPSACQLGNQCYKMEPPLRGQPRDVVTACPPSAPCVWDEWCPPDDTFETRLPVPEDELWEQVFADMLYELDGDPKRKEFLDDLFSFMQKRGFSRGPSMQQVLNVCRPNLAHRTLHGVLSSSGGGGGGGHVCRTRPLGVKRPEAAPRAGAHFGRVMIRVEKSNRSRLTFRRFRTSSSSSATRIRSPVTNASIMLAPVSMLSSDFRPGLPLPHFNKHLLGAEHGDEPHRGGFTLRLGLHQQGSEPSHLERAAQLHSVMSGTMEKSVLGGQDQLRIRVAELEDEVRNLRKVNRDLFDFSTRIITRPK
ncbi:WD repeat-containing protein 18 [Suricata suricatta]|uniref:WD repeat-containing protein 18 n=1 Tax=Suricata suricatta TaxID=37032 RepID=UPI001155BF53|nr:WD repeat-containing protein 18 [Suricata suricatta]